MDRESSPLPDHRFRTAIYRGAQLILREICIIQKNMGEGFSQANQGEAGLRMLALKEFAVDQQIENLKPAPIPDTIPENW